MLIYHLIIINKRPIMYLQVNQTLSLYGKITPPSSKSHSIRGMLFSLLAKGESTLCNILVSEDTLDAMHVCVALGANCNITQNKLKIGSNGLPFAHCPTELNTGNSGIITRCILPLLGLRKNYTFPMLLNCHEQMRNRPIQPLIDAIRNLGMDIKYIKNEGQLPITVSGQLNGGVTAIDAISSQFLSALLIALPCAVNNSIIIVKKLYSRPYVDMTLAWLKQQGIDFMHQLTDDGDIFYIRGGQQYSPINTMINGDFSGASSIIAAAALIPGEVELQGLDINDIQGDKRLLFILQKMGANILIAPEQIKIKGNKPLTGMQIDVNDIPDLVPVLAVLATSAAGKTEIYNAKQVRLKETDRIHSMVEGLRLMGAKIEESTDGMTIYPSSLQGTLVKGYNDHRTVMALSVAGMIARGTTTITNGEAINKTYPQFVIAMQSMGAHISCSE